MPHAFQPEPRIRPKGRVNGGPDEGITINPRAEREAGTLRCRCGRVALRRVGQRGYCAAHQAEAWRAAKREAGHASDAALLNWIAGMNIEEEP